MAKPRKIAHGRGYSYEITYRVDGRMVRKRFPTLKLAEQALAAPRSPRSTAPTCSAATRR